METERTCFLCGRPITEKSTEEHIFSDSFLAEFDLKRKRLRFGAPKPIEYSRLKVPAHKHCNTGLGSRFEDYVLKILHSMDTNREVLEELHRTPHSEVAKRIKETLCQWLAKLHLGLIFWETSLRHHPDPEYQASLKQYIQTPVIKCLQRCLSEWHYFNCPSSLYYFVVPQAGGTADQFDFATHPEISATFIRFNGHMLVATIGDGNLTSEWFTDHQYQRTQQHIDANKSEPFAYLMAVAHIWAVRELLPVQPRLEFTSDSVVDCSREGMHGKPPIDDAAVNLRASELFSELAQRFSRDVPRD